jgi:hypothetical protein
VDFACEAAPPVQIYKKSFFNSNDLLIVKDRIE